MLTSTLLTSTLLAGSLLGASLGLAPQSSAVGAAASPSPLPSLTVGSPVDPNEAVVLPVEDVVGRSEKLIFAEASVDGAVTDRGGREFTLASDVLFAFNKATLTSRARQEIARIARALKSSSDQDVDTAKVTRVMVTGYTDDVGGNSYNLALSTRRAGAVRAELVKALGSTVAVTAVGRGEADPVATNDTKRGRQANRRVEIRGR
ncbi:MAG TPA: OmpA family protein [Kineosporiaceae bacterium]|nr:OmpA family protein [Kineosporiaceae bacterium]